MPARINWSKPGRLQDLQDAIGQGWSYGHVARELSKKWGMQVNRSQTKQACDRYELPSHATPMSEVAESIRPFTEEWHLEGDWVLTGDWELPYLSPAIFQQMLKQARRLKIKNLMVAGDVFEFERLGPFAAVVPVPHPMTEEKVALALMDEVLDWFEDVRCILGNHDSRCIKALEGAVQPEDIMAALCSKLGGDPHVHWSVYGHCVIESETGPWRITHPKNYSRTPMAVGRKLAAKYLQHIVGFHAHATSIGFDESGRYIVAGVGCMADVTKLPYHMLVDSTHPQMNQGFAALKHGRLSVYSDHPAWGVEL
jgi:hypothetical protein